MQAFARTRHALGNALLTNLVARAAVVYTMPPASSGCRDTKQRKRKEKKGSPNEKVSSKRVKKTPHDEISPPPELSIGAVRNASSTVSVTEVYAFHSLRSLLQPFESQGTHATTASIVGVAATVQERRLDQGLREVAITGLVDILADESSSRSTSTAPMDEESVAESSSSLHWSERFSWEEVREIITLLLESLGAPTLAEKLLPQVIRCAIAHSNSPEDCSGSSQSLGLEALELVSRTLLSRQSERRLRSAANVVSAESGRGELPTKRDPDLPSLDLSALWRLQQDAVFSLEAAPHLRSRYYAAVGHLLGLGVFPDATHRRADIASSRGGLFEPDAGPISALLLGSNPRVRWSELCGPVAGLLHASTQFSNDQLFQLRGATAVGFQALATKGVHAGGISTGATATTHHVQQENYRALHHLLWASQSRMLHEQRQVVADRQRNTLKGLNHPDPKILQLITNKYLAPCTEVSFLIPAVIVLTDLHQVRHPLVQEGIHNGILRCCSTLEERHEVLRPTALAALMRRGWVVSQTSPTLPPAKGKKESERSNDTSSKSLSPRISALQLGLQKLLQRSLESKAFHSLFFSMDVVGGREEEEEGQAFGWAVCMLRLVGFDPRRGMSGSLRQAFFQFIAEVCFPLNARQLSTLFAVFGDIEEQSDKQAWIDFGLKAVDVMVVEGSPSQGITTEGVVRCAVEALAVRRRNETLMTNIASLCALVVEGSSLEEACELLIALHKASAGDDLYLPLVRQFILRIQTLYPEEVTAGLSEGKRAVLRQILSQYPSIPQREATLTLLA